MRPRSQQGQIVRDGSSGVFRYCEDRIENGQTKRVRIKKVLCQHSEHPLRGTSGDIERD